MIYLAYEFTNFIVSQVHVPCCAMAKEGMLMVNAGVKSDGKDLNVTSRHPIVIHLIVQVMDSASLVNVNVHLGLVDQTVKMASQKPFSFWFWVFYFNFPILISLLLINLLIVSVDCPDPLCSNHGSCHGGQCWCKVGWTDVNCSQADGRLIKFLPNCSSHGMTLNRFIFCKQFFKYFYLGVYDLDTSKCVCFPNWFGPKCEIGNCLFPIRYSHF